MSDQQIQCSVLTRKINNKLDAATTAATITITPSVPCRNCKATGLLEPATQPRNVKILQHGLARSMGGQAWTKARRKKKAGGQTKRGGGGPGPPARYGPAATPMLWPILIQHLRRLCELNLRPAQRCVVEA